MHVCFQSYPRRGHGRVDHRPDAGRVRDRRIGGPDSGDVFRVPVTGSLHSAGLPVLAFTGNVQVVYPPNPSSPPDPVIPPNPIRVATILRDVVGTGGGVSCDARGAETFRLDQGATDTLTFTGSYRLYPPVPILPTDPILPQNAACRGREVGVRYVINLDDAGQVIGVPTATITCVDLNCPDTLSRTEVE
jgi:hypothetical protein